MVDVITAGARWVAGAAAILGLASEPATLSNAARQRLWHAANAIGANGPSAATPMQAVAAPSPQSCATTPAAPGCDDLSALAKALASALETCTQQPDAGVCPQVTGPDVQPPVNLLDPSQLQNNIPTDRLWLYSGSFKLWFTIAPAVTATCAKDGTAAGCAAVTQTLQSIGRLQTVCRGAPGSPACGGGTSPPRGAPELTPGTPTAPLNMPIFVRYLDSSFAGGGTLATDLTVIGPPQASTGPLQPATLFGAFAPIDGSVAFTQKLNVVPTLPIAGVNPSFSGSGSIPLTLPPPAAAAAVPAVDLVQSADTFQVTPNGLNQSVQLMIVVTINQVMQGGGKNDDGAASIPPMLMLASARERSGRPVFARRVAASRESASTGAAAVAEQQPPLRVFITSLGTSTGEAFEMQAFGADGAPVQLRGDGLVVQPLNDDNARRTQQELQRQVKTATSRASARLVGYCLEFLRLPPSKGMMFQVAGSSLQQKFTPMRRILEASRQVRAAGELVPDSEPEGYFHSISQWALWTREQNFNQRSYGDAFVGHTRKNFEQAGGKWSDQVEQVVRKVVPSRWNAITRILQRAAAL